MADYGDERDDADAMLALLRADDQLTVYPDESGGPSTVPPGAEPPYVSVHFVSEHTYVGEALVGKSTRTITRAFAHCVGSNDIAARAVLNRVKALWLDVKPTLPGRSVFPIRHEQTRDAQPTEPVAKTTVSFTAIYKFEHSPGV